MMTSRQDSWDTSPTHLVHPFTLQRTVALEGDGGSADARREFLSSTALRRCSRTQWGQALDQFERASPDARMLVLLLARQGRLFERDAGGETACSLASTIRDRALARMLCDEVLSPRSAAFQAPDAGFLTATRAFLLLRNVAEYVRIVKGLATDGVVYLKSGALLSRPHGRWRSPRELFHGAVWRLVPCNKRSMRDQVVTVVQAIFGKACVMKGDIEPPCILFARSDERQVTTLLTNVRGDRARIVLWDAQGQIRTYHPTTSDLPGRVLAVVAPRLS